MWGEGGGYSTNVHTGRLRPEVQPLTLLYTIFHCSSVPTVPDCGLVTWRRTLLAKTRFIYRKSTVQFSFYYIDISLNLFSFSLPAQTVVRRRNFLKFSPFVFTCKELGFRIILSHCKVFFFVFTFSCSSEKDFMPASDNFTNISLAVFS